MKQVQRKSTPWRTFGNWRKRLHKLRPALIFLQNTGLLEKHVQTLVKRTSSSDFKTHRNSLKNTRLRLVFSTSLGVWKSKEVLLLVFELLPEI